MAAQQFHLGYLTSEPLILRNEEKSIPMVELDLAQEEELLKKSLDNSNKKVQVIHEIATVTNVGALVTRGCHALHYSGHGVAKSLCFEDAKGQVHSITPAELKKLVKPSENEDIHIQFVFVSACHSEHVGDAFVSAGVPHVVAIKQKEEVQDAASLMFLSQFYLALFVGRTVQYAFDAAKRAVEQSPELQNSEKEYKKFLLLGNGDHETTIFPNDGLDDGAYVYHSPQEKVLRGLHTRPKPFIGREIDMQRAFSDLYKHRLMQVYGAQGIGKTAFITFLSHYIYDRAGSHDFMDFEGVFYIPIDQEYLDMYKTLGQVCWSEIQSRTRSDSRIESNRQFFAEIGEKRYLFLFDSVEIITQEMIDEHSQLHIVNFIDELLNRCANVKVVVASQVEMKFTNQSRDIKLDKLTSRQSARIFRSLLQRRFRDKEKQLMQELDRDRDLISRLSHHPAIIYCDGNPRMIAAAAKKALDFDLDQIQGILNETKEWDIQSSITFPKSQAPADARRGKRTFVIEEAETFWMKLGTGVSTDDPVKFDIVRGELARYFTNKTGQHDRPLTDDDLNWIENHYMLDLDDDEMVHFPNFRRFWEWFKGFVQVIVKCRTHWTTNIIYGLADKQDTHDLVFQQKEGTCLIRFSQSYPGAFGIVYKYRGDTQEALCTLKGNQFQIEQKIGSQTMMGYFRNLKEVLNKSPDLDRIIKRDESSSPVSVSDI